MGRKYTDHYIMKTFTIFRKAAFPPNCIQKTTSSSLKKNSQELGNIGSQFPYPCTFHHREEIYLSRTIPAIHGQPSWSELVRLNFSLTNWRPRVVLSMEITIATIRNLEQSSLQLRNKNLLATTTFCLLVRKCTLHFLVKEGHFQISTARL